jgi:peptidylprolyl isomerase
MSSRSRPWRAGAYDNVAFHRVIDGFMAQTGDVQFGNMERGYNSQRAGTGGSDLGNIPAEFSNAFERGTVGMARAQDPNSANSQFFITFAPTPNLNGSLYRGRPGGASGMEHVDNIKRGDRPPMARHRSRPDDFGADRRRRLIH